MFNNKGLFIVLDAIDGSGKSTQAALLKARFEQEGRDVILTREPGGTGCPGAEEIRNLLVNGPKDRWDGISELMLFSAARRNHVKTVIEPALAEGKIVICDRFVPSTIAYQGFGRGLDLSTIQTVTDLAIGDLRPDITIYLYVDVEEGLRRTQTRRGTEMRFESMDLQFYHSVKAGYEFVIVSGLYTGNYIIQVDASSKDDETVDESILRIFNDIWTNINYLLKIA